MPPLLLLLSDDRQLAAVVGHGRMTFPQGRLIFTTTVMAERHARDTDKLEFHEATGLDVADDFGVEQLHVQIAVSLIRRFTIAGLGELHDGVLTIFLLVLVERVDHHRARIDFQHF